MDPVILVRTIAHRLTGVCTHTVVGWQDLITLALILTFLDLIVTVAITLVCMLHTGALSDTDSFEEAYNCSRNSGKTWRGTANLDLHVAKWSRAGASKRVEDH